MTLERLVYLLNNQIKLTGPDTVVRYDGPTLQDINIVQLENEDGEFVVILSHH